MASGGTLAYYYPFCLDSSFADKWQEVGQTVTDSAPYTCPADGLYILYQSQTTSSSSGRWQLSAPNGTNASKERFFLNQNTGIVTDATYFKKGTILYTRGSGSTLSFTVKGYYSIN